MNTKINLYQVHIYFNMYIIRSIYFECRVLELNKIQDKALQSIYEVPLLKKLRLGEKLPQVLMYARKIARGVGLL